MLWKMEHLLQKSKCSIFHNIFKYMTFQKCQMSLLWSKGLIVMRNIECCDQNSLIVRNLGFWGLGPGNAQQILAFILKLCIMFSHYIFKKVNNKDMIRLCRYTGFMCHCCLHTMFYSVFFSVIVYLLLICCQFSFQIQWFTVCMGIRVDSDELASEDYIMKS